MQHSAEHRRGKPRAGSTAQCALRYAKGSANECIAILETAHASGYIRVLPQDLIRKLQMIIGTLFMCIGGHR